MSLSLSLEISLPIFLPCCQPSEKIQREEKEINDTDFKTPWGDRPAKPEKKEEGKEENAQSLLFTLTYSVSQAHAPFNSGPQRKIVFTIDGIAKDHLAVSHFTSQKETNKIDIYLSFAFENDDDDDRLC